MAKAGLVAVVAPSILSSVLLLSGCSDNPTESVHVTLCKDIARVKLPSVGAVTWNQGDMEIHRPEYAVIHVLAGSPPTKVSCYYNHNAVEDTALGLSNPLSEYATSPFKVTINGQQLSKSALAESVKQAMLLQGSEFVDRAKQGVQNATESVKSGLSSGK